MFVNLLTVMLQGQPSAMPSMLIMVGMVVVMYFFMIRPQAKRAKEQKKFADTIAAGERIVTTSGIHAVINRVNDDGTLQIEVGRGTFMIVERSAVSMEMTAAYRKKTDATSTTATTAVK
ncbi:MAG: preprotein translocase subunit YajC [Sphingobacteriales bacterium]|nr:MAG: preprotein translocase subunit YajC [Sphingobacteriales bacterium]